MAGLHKQISRAQARDDLVDALANQYHVNAVDRDAGDDDRHLMLTVLFAMTTARDHFEAERDGDDGVTVEVVA